MSLWHLLLDAGWPFSPSHLPPDVPTLSAQPEVRVEPSSYKNVLATGFVPLGLKGRAAVLPVNVPEHSADVKKCKEC